ncbi:hypothetical protein SAMN05216184_104106 [Georgenia satyanarayanai]|uniref:Mu-like prophage major head subunit gpT n=1 Tax=Georgenia satyanarayanai TaxID=860221 RepID=A0A2Y9A7Q7_9MICO|nr:hypothetical protein [Georgenia satyanarayanai]PYG00167.1 hypothetical protein A8987_104106 [Georgenia satyanarayanai]SSA40390.1 hypothetical protein SAMN05216184_104106 [Georgenia satyanarayanai]
MSSSIINVGESFGLTDAGTLLGASPTQRRQYSPKRAQAIVEAAAMWGRAWDGSERAALLVREALSTSDLFRSVTGDVLDRELLAAYRAQTPQWAGFATRTTVRNFKPKKLVDLLGGRTALERVPELTEYPEAVHDTREYQIEVAKFGRRFGFSWEASINDDLDELQRIPSNFAAAAGITEDVTALERLVVPATGAPNPEFFKADNGNAPEAKVLDHANLGAAITKVSTREDDEGNLVPPDGGLVLVVGPAQEMTARQILNATEIRTVTGNKTVVEPNPLRNVSIRLEVNRRIKGLAWFVLPEPNGPRPAIAVAFLRGHETPDIRIKNDAGNRPGGGSIDPTEGSFNEDGVFYRVRHVVGSANVDPIHTYAATGQA